VHYPVPLGARGRKPKRETVGLIKERIEKNQEIIVVPKNKIAPERLHDPLSRNGVVKNESKVKCFIIVSHHYFRLLDGKTGIDGQNLVKTVCFLCVLPVGFFNNPSILSAKLPFSHSVQNFIECAVMVSLRNGAKVCATDTKPAAKKQTISGISFQMKIN
jgi:hypothetical protein